MWCADDPRRGRLVRPGQVSDGIERSTAQAKWADVLRGQALDDYLGKRGPGAAVMARLRSMTQSIGNGIRRRRP